MIPLFGINTCLDNALSTLLEERAWSSNFISAPIIAEHFTIIKRGMHQTHRFILKNIL